MPTRATTGAAQVLAELELCSTVRARSYVPVVSGPAPATQPPHGDVGVVDYWRGRFATAAPAEVPMLVRQARSELRAIKRRRFPVVRVRDGDDLRKRIVQDGEGLPPEAVALALRCTPTLVRRSRLATGREPEHGREVELTTPDPAALVAAGLSLRAVEAVTGVPRSTLAGRIARTANATT